MEKYKSQNTKSQSSQIILAIFFIIIVLAMIFLFTQIHTSILFSNYNFNEQKNEKTLLLNIRERLLTCYGYPLIIENPNCAGIENLNFKIKIIENDLCKSQTIYQQGTSTNIEHSLFIPVKNTTQGHICPAQLILYGQEMEDFN